MFSHHTRPKWWQLYLTLPLLFGLFAVDSRLRLSTRGHQIVQIGILVFVYGLIYVWLKANTGVLSRMDREQNYRRIKVVRIPVSELPESGYENNLRLGLQGLERKGLLSDTFEMETIDLEFLPVDEVSQKVDKE